MVALAVKDSIIALKKNIAAKVNKEVFQVQKDALNKMVKDTLDRAVPDASPFCSTMREAIDVNVCKDMKASVYKVYTTMYESYTGDKILAKVGGSYFIEKAITTLIEKSIGTDYAKKKITRLITVILIKVLGRKGVKYVVEFFSKYLIPGINILSVASNAYEVAQVAMEFCKELESPVWGQMTKRLFEMETEFGKKGVSTATKELEAKLAAAKATALKEAAAAGAALGLDWMTEEFLDTNVRWFFLKVKTGCAWVNQKAKAFNAAKESIAVFAEKAMKAPANVDESDVFLHAAGFDAFIEKETQAVFSAAEAESSSSFAAAEVAPSSEPAFLEERMHVKGLKLPRKRTSLRKPRPAAVPLEEMITSMRAQDAKEIAQTLARSGTPDADDLPPPEVGLSAKRAVRPILTPSAPSAAPAPAGIPAQVAAIVADYTKTLGAEVAAGVAKKLGDFPVIMYVKIIVDVFRSVQKHGFVAGLMESIVGNSENDFVKDFIIRIYGLGRRSERQIYCPFWGSGHYKPSSCP